MPAAIQIVNSQNGSPIYVRVYRASLEAGQLTPWRRHAFQQAALYLAKDNSQFPQVVRSYNGMVEVLTKTQDILIVVLGNDEENELDLSEVTMAIVSQIQGVLKKNSMSADAILEKLGKLCQYLDELITPSGHLHIVSPEEVRTNVKMAQMG